MNERKKRILIGIFGAVVCATILLGGLSAVPQVALAASCNLRVSGPATVQPGSSILVTVTANCKPNVAGNNWACNFSNGTLSPSFSVSQAGVTALAETDQITGVSAGSGLYNYSAECSDTADPAQFPSGSKTITVTPASSGGGSVNVTSENSVITADLVSSEWNFAGSVTDPCGGNQANCSGTNVSYANQPAGSIADTYTLNVTAGAAGTGYSLRSIQQNIAKDVSFPKNPVLAFFENFFAAAHASVVCGFLNTNPSSCPTPANTFTLAGANDTANFIILWDPIANMAPIATPITLTSAVPSQAVPLANNGSAGSTLNWTAGAPVYAGAGGWLTVSPTNGSVSGGGSQNITFTANPAAVPIGSYSATVTFTATSAPGVPPTGNPLPSQTVTVNFDNGVGVSPVKIISTTPSSTVSVTTPITAVCSGGSGAYKWTASGPAIPASGAGVSFTFSYSFPSPSGSPYILTCIDANNPNSTDSEPITITQVTPTCAFAANPPQIVVPDSSTLSWTCVNAVSCNIGGISVNPVSGTFSVSPVSDTTYTLSCKGPGSGPGSTTNVQTTVSVVGPGIIETPPGGK